MGALTALVCAAAADSDIVVDSITADPRGQVRLMCGTIDRTEGLRVSSKSHHCRRLAWAFWSGLSL